MRTRGRGGRGGRGGGSDGSDGSYSAQEVRGAVVYASAILGGGLRDARRDGWRIRRSASGSVRVACLTLTSFPFEAWATVLSDAAAAALLYALVALYGVASRQCLRKLGLAGGGEPEEEEEDDDDDDDDDAGEQHDDAGRGGGSDAGGDDADGDDAEVANCLGSAIDDILLLLEDLLVNALRATCLSPVVRARVAIALARADVLAVTARMAAGVCDVMAGGDGDVARRRQRQRAYTCAFRLHL